MFLLFDFVVMVQPVFLQAGMVLMFLMLRLMVLPLPVTPLSSETHKNGYYMFYKSVMRSERSVLL